MTYQTDFYSWTVEQAAALRQAAARRINPAAGIDWENVAEEIESLGRSELRAMESALVRILEHLLKLRYSPAAEPRAGWRESVAVHRDDLFRLKQDNPGLIVRIDLAGAYASARRIAAASLESRDGVAKSVLPAACPFSPAEIENDDWYPDGPSG